MKEITEKDYQKAVDALSAYSNYLEVDPERIVIDVIEALGIGAPFFARQKRALEIRAELSSLSNKKSRLQTELNALTLDQELF